ncbi:hypothetical protein SUDANB105_00495 [Streptomyces sp. enrichment culture]
MRALSPGDPSSIGTYRLLGRLGSGGMGRVYLGRAPGGRIVAVKLVQEELARQGEFRARFAREVAAARKVGGEWTAAVLDSDTDAEQPWVATAYVAGPSLESVVAEGYGPLPPESVRALAHRLARQLGHRAVRRRRPAPVADVRPGQRTGLAGAGERLGAGQRPGAGQRREVLRAGGAMRTRFSSGAFSMSSSWATIVLRRSS